MNSAMKLRTKFAILLVALTLVLSLAVYGGLEFYKRQQVSETQSQVEEMAQVSARQIDATIGEQRDYVGYIASQPEAREFDRSDRYIRAFRANTRSFSARIVAANGTIIAYRGAVTEDSRQSILGANHSNRTYVRRALSGGVYVSDAQQVGDTDRQVIRYSAVIFGPEGPKGVFSTAMYLNDRTVFTTVEPLNTTDQRVLVAAGNRTLYGGGERFGTAIAGESTVDTTGWSVRVIRDQSGLASRLQGLVIAQGLGLLFVLLVAIGFGYWEYRTSLRQTERLLSAFGEVRDGNYEYTVDLGESEEWSSIGEGFNDLTEGLAEREAAIREHEQRLGVLNRVLRHNLRNDMTVVLGHAQRIEAGTDDDALGLSASSIVDTGEDLLALGEKARHIEELHERDLEPIRVDAVTAIDEAMTAVRDEFPDADVTVDVPERQPVRAVDELRTVVEYLVDNACRHGDQPVEVTLAETEDRVRLTVADAGPGIPEHELDTIREGQETSLEHGSGLGLWIVHWIVEKSEGDLQFDTDDGTTVHVDLDPVPTGEDGTEDGDESTDETELTPADVRADGHGIGGDG
ncbi:histidine kinase [Halobacteriales archaeon SW_7_68_16]|nr:MAG: histidine kinase [Halobacteriales archaeon SW_7_68_16]